MQLRYLGHACLSIEVAGKRILTDPWWKGSAYNGQWYPYPRPQHEPSDCENVDFILISHGREDHLHIPTLRTINQDATVVIPLRVRPELRNLLRSLGFRRVIELPSGEENSLAPGLRLTAFDIRGKGVFALEGEGRVLLHAHDALFDTSIQERKRLYCQIMERFPSIDSMFMSMCRTSWYPNCIHFINAPQPDPLSRWDRQRRTFVEAVKVMTPRRVFSLQASYVVLEEHLNWMNILHERQHSPKEILHAEGVFESEAEALRPGDEIHHEQIKRAKAPTKNRDIQKQFQAIYNQEFSELRRKKDIDDKTWNRVLTAMRNNGNNRNHLLLHPGQTLEFRIDLLDLQRRSLLVTATREAFSVVECSPHDPANAVVKTRWHILEAWVTEDFGYQSITVGCGATLHLRKQDFYLRRMIIDLVSRKPMRPSRAERIAIWLRYPRRKLATLKNALPWRAPKRHLVRQPDF